MNPCKFCFFFCLWTVLALPLDSVLLAGDRGHGSQRPWQSQASRKDAPWWEREDKKSSVPHLVNWISPSSLAALLSDFSSVPCIQAQLMRGAVSSGCWIRRQEKRRMWGRCLYFSPSEYFFFSLMVTNQNLNFSASFKIHPLSGRTVRSKIQVAIKLTSSKSFATVKLF